jgi:hypothetical protein
LTEQSFQLIEVRLEDYSCESFFLHLLHALLGDFLFRIWLALFAVAALFPYEFIVGKAALAAFSDFNKLALILKQALGRLSDRTRDRILLFLETMDHTCVACDFVLATLPVGECG